MAFMVVIAAGVPLARSEQVPDPPAGGAKAGNRFIPLPLYAISPNEGSTYGVMPVMMRVDDAGDVRLIAAPSVSWNSSARISGTARLYLYPSTVRQLSLIASASTRINRTLWLTYTDLPTEKDQATLELDAMLRRNIFFRFFGLGPDTPARDETSYTRFTASLMARWGWNLTRWLNVGVRGMLRGDRPERHTIGDLPATQDRFPTAPGIAGASVAVGEISVRVDSRPDGPYSENGVGSELRGSFHRGLTGFDDGNERFWRVGWRTRALWQETRRLQAAVQAYWTDMLRETTVPFYYQSALGGELLMRGFPEDRFIDRGAWEVDLEQRIRILQTHIFGVVADWRADPFVSVGQVYGRFADIGSHVRVAAGLGLRAWVHPNIVGRVDVAYAGEGLRAYVFLGYPF